MPPLEIQAPEGSAVFNWLYPGYREYTVLSVRLPNDCQVDAGWYPLDDPDGGYIIRVFWQSWEYQLIEPRYTRDVAEVARIAQELIWEFSEAATPPPRHNPNGASP